MICLTAFFALQYGKLVSYWHCRIASMYTATPCDCVQQLLDTHKDTSHHASTLLNEKTEDVVWFHEPHTHWQPAITTVSYVIAYLADKPSTYAASIFQPPRL